MAGEADPGSEPRGATVAPFGSWSSPIDIELVSGGSVGISEPMVDGDDVYWLEGRSAEGGRRTLLRRGPDGATHELTPVPFNVRNKVHEYGGGSYLAAGGRVIASSGRDGRLHRIDPEGLTPPVAFTPEGPYRFADMRFDPRADRLYAVRESHDPIRDKDPLLVENEIVALALDGSDGAGRVLVGGIDFVAAPRPSPDGSTLAWL